MGILSQPAIPPLPDSLSFAGKTAIVTGANIGLGLAAALHLAQRNISTLILAVRNPKSGQTTKDALLADPIVQKRATKPTILVFPLDLSLPSSVEAFASRVIAEVPKLHIVILNAGMGDLNWKVNPETQTEAHFQVNFLSNAVLTVRLLPLLKASAQNAGEASHLTIVGSRMIALSSFLKNPIPDAVPVFTFFNDRAQFRSMTRYGDSKVLVTMWIRQLGKHIDPSMVVVNNVCPGMVKTNLEAGQPWIIRAVMSVVKGIRGRTAEVGARTLINAAIAGPETHGEMLADYEIYPYNFLKTNEGKKMETKVWEESLAAFESSSPGSVQAAGLRD
ncbi:short-chain dehydrogenase/reductase family protein [Favolaschia claudopus]|uniref:Short-chain dehydrogenase/reductase family protein n=1 Tax=Favolaschia claudopus TaxID=2862362 RepID=A0AAW0DR85_9AGAR